MSQKESPTKVRNRRRKIKSKRASAGSAQQDRQTLVPGALKPKTLVALEGEAVRRGWAVPEHKQPRIIDNLVEISETCESAKVRVTAARVLMLADQMQYERDNPERAGKAKGMQGQQVMVIDPMAMYREALKQVEAEEAVNGQYVIPTRSGGSGQDVVAEGEVLRQAAGDDKVGTRESVDGGKGRKQVG